MQDDMPTDAVGAPGSAIGERSIEKTPEIRPAPPKRRGLVYAAGAVVAIVACMAIVLVAMLPKGTATLPPMPTDVGYWDHSQDTQPAPVPNGMAQGRWGTTEPLGTTSRISTPPRRRRSRLSGTRVSQP
jgi:hypothetical protein